MNKESEGFWWTIANWLIDGGFFLILGIALAASITFSLLWK